MKNTGCTNLTIGTSCILMEQGLPNEAARLFFEDLKIPE